MRLKCLVQRWYGLKKTVICGIISAVESFGCNFEYGLKYFSRLMREYAYTLPKQA